MTKKPDATESHHNREAPWIAGRLIYEGLLALGVTPDTRVVELGCGYGSLAIWLGRQLAAGNYVGIDHDDEKLAVLSGYEAPLHDASVSVLPSRRLSEMTRGAFDLAVVRDTSLSDAAGQLVRAGGRVVAVAGDSGRDAGAGVGVKARILGEEVATVFCSMIDDQAGEPTTVEVGSALPIVDANGNPMMGFPTAPRWQDVRKRGDLGGYHDHRMVTGSELVTEAHRQAYGSPWGKGRNLFKRLRPLIDPADRLLDIGCGAGRLGVRLIDFLDYGKYSGCDNHLRSLQAFAHYEAPLHGLTDCGATLIYDGAFATDAWGLEFDAIVECSVLGHLRKEEGAQHAALRRLRAAVVPGGRLLSWGHWTMSEAALLELGWRQVNAKGATGTRAWRQFLAT